MAKKKGGLSRGLGAGIDVFIPNNPKGLLKTRYGGNIMKMPQVIGVHDKLKEFSK